MWAPLYRRTTLIAFLQTIPPQCHPNCLPQDVRHIPLRNPHLVLSIALSSYCFLGSGDNLLYAPFPTEPGLAVGFAFGCCKTPPHASVVPPLCLFVFWETGIPQPLSGRLAATLPPPSPPSLQARLPAIGGASQCLTERPYTYV